jgi:hypothetical protein
MVKKKFIFYFVRPYNNGLKWYNWIFKTFNLKFDKVNYYERGFRFFGFTFIWTK